MSGVGNERGAGGVHGHFVELRRKIRERLPAAGRDELDKYPWLYGALGDPGADVMFVCDNPSRLVVERADRRYADRGIEAQWRGRREDMFRWVLCQVGLKTGEPEESGGWQCYITNAIKEIWKVKDFNKLSTEEELELAFAWMDILQWEIDRVQPDLVYCVGDKAGFIVQALAWESRIDLAGAGLHTIWHYARPKSDDVVCHEMWTGILEGAMAPRRDHSRPLWGAGRHLRLT